MPWSRNDLNLIRSTRKTKNQRQTNRERKRSGLPSEQETLMQAVQLMMGIEPDEALGNHPKDDERK